MLSSSDAKWRCMWHMLIWSIIMTLVSQFLDVRDHVVFFMFSAVTMLGLPMITSIYSNTSGRHGAGLLRVGYIVCDPVLICVTITPVQILKLLPTLLDEYDCIVKYQNWNDTRACLQNRTDNSPVLDFEEVTPEVKQNIILEKRFEVLKIQTGMIVPILMSLCMGRRTRKMALNTYIFVFMYWLIVAIEAADLLEEVIDSAVYEHTLYTSVGIACIAMIVTNTYAIVTLCSYITPEKESDVKPMNHRFDFLYRAFISVVGILFAELPFLIARVHIIISAKEFGKFMHGSFYMWLAKDFLAMCLIPIIVFLSKALKRYSNFFKVTCAPPFDSPDAFFLPEKRDTYIHKQSKQMSFSRQMKPLSPVTTVDAANEQLERLPDEPLLPSTSTVDEDRKKELKSKKVTFKLDRK